jgi:hypothetical protein
VPFLAIHLTNDAFLEIAAMAATTTALATAKATAAVSGATATATTVRVLVATPTAATLHGDVGGGVRAAIADLTALFMAHELSLELREGDRVITIGGEGMN